MTIGEQIPLWLDCDPGNDDVFAILLAVFHPRFNLLGISTVHGNAPVEDTTTNALGVLDVLNIHNVHVYRGSKQPLVNPPKFAESIHGKGGLGGVRLPQAYNSESTDVSYLEAMRNAILNHEHRIVVACTGTLTNFSHLISKYPEVKSKIRYVAMMGGGIGLGNVTPYAEFNFHADPHAAKHVVSEIGSKIVLSPLNITHTAMATEEIRSRMYHPGTDHDSPARKFFHDIVVSFYSAYQVERGSIPGPPVHDPLALYLALAMIDRDPIYKFKYSRRKLVVEDEGIRAGQSVVLHKDLDPSVEEEDGVYIGESVDIDLFWDAVLDCLLAADKNIASAKKLNDNRTSRETGWGVSNNTSQTKKVLVNN